MKKTLSLIIPLFMIHQYTFSQNQNNIDSLERELKKFEAARREIGNQMPPLFDSTKAYLLYELSRQYWGNDPDKALSYAEECLAVSEKSGFEKGIAKAFYSKGIIHSDWSEYPDALQFQERALKIYLTINDRSGIADAYNEMGLCFYYMGKNPEALNNYLKSIRINEELGNKKAAAGAYMNMGNVYTNIKKYDDALNSHFLSLNAFNEIGFKKGIAMAHNNIGVVYFKQNKFDEALHSYKASLKIKEELGDIRGIANAYINIATIQSELNNVKGALQYYFDAVKLQQSIGDKNGLSSSYMSIGRVFEIQGKQHDAIDFMKKGQQLSLETGNMNTIKDGYLILATVYAKLDKYKSAYENHVLYKQAYDSVFNDENEKKLTQQQMQFDFDKKVQADSLKFLQEKQLDEIKLQEQKVYTFGGFSGIAVTIILLFFVYFNYNKQLIANQKLKAAQDQLIRSEKMAAFGVMASRLSHEIQNPLNFVNNFSDMSQDLVKEVIDSDDEEGKKRNAEMLISNLQKINMHGSRVAAIVKQLQEHSSRGTAMEFFDDKK